MTDLPRIATLTLAVAACAISQTTFAATTRHLLAELASLESEVHSVSELGTTGAERYSRKISDLRTRIFKSADATSEQKRDTSRRLSKLSSLIRQKTTQAGGPPVKSSRSVSSGKSRPFPTTRSRTSGLPHRSGLSNSRQSGSRDPSPDSATQKLREIYISTGKRFDRLPEPLDTKGGPLDTDQLHALKTALPRFVRDYAAAVAQWRKDLSSIRREASRVSSDDYTRQRALELVEKRFPDRLRKLVADSRKTLVSHSTGLLNYVRGEYASRERQKDNGQYIIWIGSWDMDECVQTAWDVADLGILFEKSFGGSTSLFEKAKADARVAARERTLRLQDRLKSRP